MERILFAFPLIFQVSYSVSTGLRLMNKQEHCAVSCRDYFFRFRLQLLLTFDEKNKNLSFSSNGGTCGRKMAANNVI